ncbi:hypothetical protein SMICM304S_10961 [Streptomyces microflavus]
MYAADQGKAGALSGEERGRVRKVAHQRDPAAGPAGHTDLADHVEDLGKQVPLGLRVTERVKPRCRARRGSRAGRHRRPRRTAGGPRGVAQPLIVSLSSARRSASSAVRMCSSVGGAGFPPVPPGPGGPANGCCDMVSPLVATPRRRRPEKYRAVAAHPELEQRNSRDREFAAPAKCEPRRRGGVRARWRRPSPEADIAEDQTTDARKESVGMISASSHPRPIGDPAHPGAFQCRSTTRDARGREDEVRGQQGPLLARRSPRVAARAQSPP